MNLLGADRESELSHVSRVTLPLFGDQLVAPGRQVSHAAALAKAEVGTGKCNRAVGDALLITGRLLITRPLGLWAKACPGKTKCSHSPK